MLDYTKMAIKQTISDLKKTDYIRNVATQIIYIIYLIYTLIVGTGYLALNIVLLVISTSYFVFFLTMTSLGKTPEGKTVKKTGTAVYVWCKRLIKLFTLGLTVYGICTAVEHVSALSVILAALMIVGWCLQIIFEVLIKILTNRVNFILEGLEADLDNMLKPVRSVGNFFKKVTGKEVTPQKELTKNQLKLKEKVEAYRAEQKRKKAEEKIRREVERTAAKQTAKEQKREQKNSVRIETKLLRDADKQKKAEEKAARLAGKNAAEEDAKYLPSADAGANAETALALSDAPETDARKKPSLFRRLKAKLTGGEENGALSPDKEVFEEEENENAFLRAGRGGKRGLFRRGTDPLSFGRRRRRRGGRRGPGGRKRIRLSPKRRGRQAAGGASRKKEQANALSLAAQKGKLTLKIKTDGKARMRPSRF